MIINKRIFYEAPESGGSGGGEVPVAPTVDTVVAPEGTPLEQGPVVTEPTIPGAETTNTEPTPEGTHGEEEEVFDPSKVNFGDNTAEYGFLNEEGIDASTPEYRGIIDQINKMGVTDPKIVANFVREYKKGKEAAEEKPLTQKETMAKLNKELSPELKRNYSQISNVVKRAFEGDEELKGTYDAVMSSPYGVKMVNAIMRAANGGTDPNPSPATVAKTSGGISFDEAIRKFDIASAESRNKNGGFSMSEKKRIVSEISSTMNPVDVNKFKERYF